MSQFTYDFYRDYLSDKTSVPIIINHDLFLNDIFHIYNDGSKVFVGR